MLDHPDIIAMERYGRVSRPGEQPVLGECASCHECILKGAEHVESDDAIFCDMECCYNYYGIEECE